MDDIIGRIFCPFRSPGLCAYLVLCFFSKKRGKWGNQIACLPQSRKWCCIMRAYGEGLRKKARCSTHGCICHVHVLPQQIHLENFARIAENQPLFAQINTADLQYSLKRSKHTRHAFACPIGYCYYKPAVQANQGVS